MFCFTFYFIDSHIFLVFHYSVRLLYFAACYFLGSTIPLFLYATERAVSSYLLLCLMLPVYILLHFDTVVVPLWVVAGIILMIQFTQPSVH